MKLWQINIKGHTHTTATLWHTKLSHVTMFGEAFWKMFLYLGTLQKVAKQLTPRAAAIPSRQNFILRPATKHCKNTVTNVNNGPNNLHGLRKSLHGLNNRHFTAYVSSEHENSLCQLFQGPVDIHWKAPCTALPDKQKKFKEKFQHVCRTA